MESAMLKGNFPMRNVPRVELDQRAREARLRLERVERLLVPHPAARYQWLRWLICILEVRFYAGARNSRTGGSLSEWWPSLKPA